MIVLLYLFCVTYFFTWKEAHISIEAKNRTLIQFVTLTNFKQTSSDEISNIPTLLEAI